MTSESIFDLVEGLRPVDPASLAEFKRTMEEEAIPEIVRVMQERQRLAAESRQWIIT